MCKRVLRVGATAVLSVSLRPKVCRARGARRFDYPVDLRDAAVPLVAAAKRLCTHLLEHVHEQSSLCASGEQHFFLYTKGHGSEGARYGNGLWVELKDETWKMVYAPDEWARMHDPMGCPMNSVEGWIWQLGETAWTAFWIAGALPGGLPRIATKVCGV